MPNPMLRKARNLKNLQATARAVNDANREDERVEIVTDHMVETISKIHIHKNNYRDVPDDLKLYAVSLVMMGYKYKAVGEALNVSPQAVKLWCVGDTVDPIVLADFTERLQQSLKMKLWIGATAAFNAAHDPEKMDKSSSLQLNTMMCQDVEKARLMDSKSTESVEMLHIHVNNINDKHDALNAQIDAKKARLAKLEAILDVKSEVVA